MHSLAEYEQVYVDYPCNAFEKAWEWYKGDLSEEGSVITETERDNLRQAQAEDMICLSERANIINTYQLEDLNELQTENMYNLGDYIASEINETTQTLNDSLDSINNGVYELQDSIEGIPESIKESVEESLDGFDESMEDFTVTYQSEQDLLRNTIDFLTETVQEGLSDGVDNIKNVLSSVFDSLTTVQQDMSNNIAEGFLGIYHALEDTIKEEISGVKEGITTTANVLKENTTKLIETAKDNFDKLKTGITTGIEFLQESVNIGTELLSTGLISIVPSFFESLNGLFDFNENDLIEKVNWFKNMYSSFAEAMLND